MNATDRKAHARVDMAKHSRHLRKRAIWCGVVFGLATLFTVLNALPPVNVRYNVNGNVLLEPRRMKELARNLKRMQSQPDSTRLLDFQVLDRAEVDFSTPAEFNVERLLFLNIVSAWTERCDNDKFGAWVDWLTRPSAVEPRETQAGDSLRMAQWELAAAQHYRAQHEFLSSGQVASSPGQPGTESPRSSVFHLVATDRQSSPQQTSHDGAGDGIANSANQALDQQAHWNQTIATLSHQVAALQSAATAATDNELGAVQVADRLTIVARADPVPFWMATSVLILGLAVGASAGLVHLRLQSTGVYNPDEVAGLLTANGLTVVANVQLPADEIEASDWMEIAARQVVGAGRGAARNIISISEWVLGFWSVLIVARLIMDPLWRSMLVESPLAAFGRLLAGMP